MVGPHIQCAARSVLSPHPPSGAGVIEVTGGPEVLQGKYKQKVIRKFGSIRLSRERAHTHMRAWEGFHAVFYEHTKSDYLFYFDKRQSRWKLESFERGDGASGHFGPRTLKSYESDEHPTLPRGQEWSFESFQHTDRKVPWHADGSMDGETWMPTQSEHSSFASPPPPSARAPWPPVSHVVCLIGVGFRILDPWNMRR